MSDDEREIARLLRVLRPAVVQFAARAMRSTGGRLEYEDALAIAQAAVALSTRTWSPDGGATREGWARVCAANAVQRAIKSALARSRYGVSVPVEEYGDEDTPPTARAWSDASQEHDAWLSEIADAIERAAASLPVGQRAALAALVSARRAALAEAESITRQAVDHRIKTAIARLRAALAALGQDDID